MAVFPIYLFGTSTLGVETTRSRGGRAVRQSAATPASPPSLAIPVSVYR
jgi:hypothetical protein